MSQSRAVSAAPTTAGFSIPLWQRVLPWLISAACLVYLYTRLQGAAAAQGSALIPYLAGVFASVSWLRWLALMIPYCVFFFLIDTLVLWRVINWFNTTIAYKDILPVRASAYILSIIIGARRLEQFEENIGSLTLQLRPEHLGALNRVSEPSLNFPANMLRRVNAFMHHGATINGERWEPLALLTASPPAVSA